MTENPAPEGVTITHGLPADDYHAADGINASLLKAIARHPLARVKWDRDHPERKDEFDLGTVAHSVILENDESGIVEVDAKDWRTNAAKEKRAEARAAGKIALLPPDVAKVRAMAAAVHDNASAHRLLTGGRAEVSMFAPLYGALAKARLDYWHEDATVIVDLKTVRDARPAEATRDFFKLGYDQQAAHYQDVAEAATGRPHQFVIVAVEKAEPYLTNVFMFEPADLDLAREENGIAAQRWQLAVADGVYPGFNGITTLTRPKYLTRSTDDDQ